MKSIIKKELKSMCTSPAYFVILAVFIALLNFLFLKGFLVDTIMNFRGYFDLQIWFLMIFIPAISMRIMSEEIKSNTLELLLTKPISLLRIIGGKYSSLLIYFSVFILSSLILYFSLGLLGSFPGGIIISQIFGSILLIGAMFSVSFLASSITKNQVFAFLLWVLINFLLIIIGSQFIQFSLPYFLANFLWAFSYLSHADNFSKGVISLSDVLYFTSVMFFGLYLSYVSIKRFQKTGKTGLGIVSLSELAIILVILIFGNALIAKVHLFIDVTPNNIYTLSDATKSILADVDDRVNVDLYTSKQLPPQLQLLYTRLRDMIGQFNDYAGNNIYLTEINPLEDNREQEAQQNGIPPIQIQIMKDDQFATQKWYLGIAIKYVGKTETIPYLGNTENLEYALVSKILKLTHKDKKTVDIIYSDDIDDKVIQNLGKTFSDNYEVHAQKIDKDATSIESADDSMYVVLEWENTFNSEISAKIKDLVDKKVVVYFFQPVSVNLKDGLKASPHPGELSKDLLTKFHLKVPETLAGDAKYNSAVNFNQGNVTYMVPYPLFPKTFVNSDLPISEWVTNVNAPFISPLETDGTNTSDMKDLITTSEFGFIHKTLDNIAPDSFTKINQSDLQKVSLGKLISSDTSKTAIIPSTYMWSMVGQDMLSSNLKFASNLLDFLGGDQRLINIRSKSLTFESFVTDKFKNNIIRWINVFALPILLLLLGIGIAFFRNKKRA